MIWKRLRTSTYWWSSPFITKRAIVSYLEKVSELLFDRDAAYIAQLLQGNHFSNAAGSRIITNLKPEVRDNVYCFMYPEEYAMTENDESDSSSSTSDEEELGNDDEEEHEQRDVAQH